MWIFTSPSEIRSYLLKVLIENNVHIIVEASTMWTVFSLLLLFEKEEEKKIQFVSSSVNLPVHN